jgi:hypothetical protein
MSGKIKIGGLVLAAALVVLWAWFAYGQANQDPCGGHYVGQALQAKFLSQYTENGIAYDGNICNDMEDVWYRYFVPGGDCVFLFRAGHIIVGVNQSGSGRDVAMHFDKKEDIPGCNDFAFMNDGIFSLRPRVIDGVLTYVQFEQVIEFMMTLRYRLALAPDNPDDPDVLVLTGGGYDTNFGEMTEGETMYCSDAVKFKVYPIIDPKNPITYNQNSQVKVTYRQLTDIEGGGMGWEVTPIHEPFYYLTYKKVWISKKNYVLEPVYTYHDTSLYRDISTSTGACGDIFYFPFKLIIKRFP